MSKETIVEKNMLARVRAGEELPAVEDRYIDPLDDYLDQRFMQVQRLIIELLKAEVRVHKVESKLDKFMATLVKLLEAKGEGHDWEALAKEEESHD